MIARPRLAQLAMATLLLALTPLAHAESIALYYGAEIPPEILEIHQQVVVDGDVLLRAGVDIDQLGGSRTRLFAYVSVGEMARDMRPDSFASDWLIAANPAWQSDVVDLTHPGWRRYFLDERLATLWQYGFRGFFLDTLDSYKLGVTSAADRARHVAALVSLIHELHRRYPGVELIANRGFEILDQVAPLLSGLVAESLYDRWDAAAKRYTRVSQSDREWLVGKLRAARKRHGLPVTVIDYRPPNQRDQARQTARRIAALGFDPWVTDVDLVTLGVGAPEIIPRRLLVLFDSSSETMARSRALKLLVPILEYEGYVPELRDVRKPLPSEPLIGRYAGVLTWFTRSLGDDAKRYSDWLSARLDQGVRIAVFGELGFAPAPALQKKLGLTQASRATRSRQAGARDRSDIAIETSPLIGFEANPLAGRIFGPGLIATDPRLNVHLRVRDSRGPLRDSVITAPWGGLAMTPHLLRQGYGGELYWAIDPFAFVKNALALEPLPAPDVTTENGSRLLMIHVDSEGADRRAQLRGTPLAGDVIRRLIASTRLPHSTNDSLLAKGIDHVVMGEPGLTGAGGNLTRTNPSLTRLQPRARPVARPGQGGPSLAEIELDVSLPIADEDGYRVPGGNAAFGFRRVLETLELTDGKRRLTPITILYHAYSGATAGGLQALRDVYAWIRRQETRPVFMWEYADRVRDSYRLILTRDLVDRSWQIHGRDTLCTLRLPRSLGWPDLSHSPTVVSVRDLPSGRYVTFTRADQNRVRLIKYRPTRPIVLRSNAEIMHFRITTSDSRLRRIRIRIRARGHVPVSLVIGNLPVTKCVLKSRRYRVFGRRVPDKVFATAQRFDLPVSDTGDAVLSC
ncbi:MAG: endo alpha-1,4 polygalactosaminidase [Proteobacteria bacterium]|nr:endo alpha-1,4 polygalactosaminidase [Pseudomonadota bacterium]